MITMEGLNRLYYIMIIIAVGVVMNVLISGSEGLEKEEKIYVAIWTTIVIIVLSMRYYRK